MKTVLICLLSFFTTPLFAQGIRPDPERIAKHVNKLASDKMKGRGTGSRENKKASEYVARAFKKYSLAPRGTTGYYQPFTAKIRRVVVPDSIRETRNVIGFLDNQAPYTIIIGAHFDHLGMGMQGSSKAEKPEGQIHNGADDNASGVAGLLELARYFSENGVKESCNFLFIAFGAEELGLVGSRYFVNNPTIPLNQVNFMSNMDMIGRYDPARGVGIGGFGTASEWPAVFEGVKGDAKFFTDKAGSGGSDHGSFYTKNIPVLFFHTGGHDDYHKPTDDPAKVDSKAEAAILNIEIAIIENAMKLPRLTFSEVK
ncbi:M20/M25/M40 family metallo-hydrolase [Dyadobacter sandarakinus]|uniref:M20/M25/M40 family metallo-hydrolase n=1 Tax=Dyadobacter sandarakinus TaxID=2747268 RepID=A0ABX7IDC2_9BACT|nr:M20/M25/M40 family metallo-hydrolase [Dyadobacter sandarakinus]QRR03803.1 M20/M25/M40 family metallo-hydrolase [Dyadobacter sandarakinus]